MPAPRRAPTRREIPGTDVHRIATSDPRILSEEEYRVWLTLPRLLPNGVTAIPSLGGHAIAALLGVNPYATARDVYYNVLGLVEPQVERAVLARGRALEPLVRARYAAETGLVVAEVDAITQRYVERANVVLRASPDGVIDTPQSSARGTGLLEIKVLGEQTFTETCALGVDPHYYVQVQEYLLVFGYQWAEFAILHPDSWRILRVPVDADLVIQAEIMAVAADFWSRHILARVEPTGEMRGHIARSVVHDRPRAGAPTVVDDDHFRALALAYEQERARLEYVQGCVGVARGLLLDLMESRGIMRAIVPDFGRVTRFEQTRRSLDRHALARAHPELLLDPFMRTSASTQLRVTVAGAPDEVVDAATLPEE